MLGPGFQALFQHLAAWLRENHRLITLATSNAKVGDRSQPPPTLNLSLSELAGSGSLHRLVRLSECEWS
jgi:hypothetical protein